MKWSYPKQQQITNNKKNPPKYKTIQNKTKQRIQCEWEWKKIVNLRVYELQMAFFWEHKTLNIHLYVYVFRFSSLETRIPFIYAHRIGYPNTDNILAIANVKQLFGCVCVWMRIYVYMKTNGSVVYVNVCCMIFQPLPLGIAPFQSVLLNFAPFLCILIHKFDVFHRFFPMHDCHRYQLFYCWFCQLKSISIFTCFHLIWMLLCMCVWVLVNFPFWRGCLGIVNHIKKRH